MASMRCARSAIFALVSGVTGSCRIASTFLIDHQNIFQSPRATPIIGIIVVEMTVVAVTFTGGFCRRIKRLPRDARPAVATASAMLIATMLVD
jgi:hypothetical protein